MPSTDRPEKGKDHKDGEVVNSVKPEQPTTAQEQAASILVNLKKLEQRAAHFNDLARQVNAEERACLAELGKSKRAMKDLGKLIEQEQREQKHQQGPPQSLPRVLTGGLNEGEESPMQRIKRKVRHLEYQFPKPAHIILRIAIGSHAPVSLKPLQLRLAYKHEYEVFKLRFTLVFMVLSMFALFLVSSRVLDAIYGFAMLYYYATCVLREHILLVNGSRIRTWWFVHHYISIVLSGITLIWPASPLYQKFRTHFFAFSLYISAMQYLQYRYQRSRLYVLVALDRARPMDTVAGEGGFFAAEREFRLLVPFLAVGQVWQGWNAVLLLRPWWEWSRRIMLEADLYDHSTGWWAAAVANGPPKEAWQGTVAGLLFAVLAVGNSVATIRTWRAKSKQRTNRGKTQPASPIAGHLHAL